MVGSPDDGGAVFSPGEGRLLGRGGSAELGGDHCKRHRANPTFTRFYKGVSSSCRLRPSNPFHDWFPMNGKGRHSCYGRPHGYWKGPASGLVQGVTTGRDTTIHSQPGTRLPNFQEAKIPDATARTAFKITPTPGGSSNIILKFSNELHSVRHSKPGPIYRAHFAFRFEPTVVRPGDTPTSSWRRLVRQRVTRWLCLLSTKI